MSEAVLNRFGVFTRALPGKLRAVSIHLSISVAIFLVLLYLILKQWYPLPYFATDGGWQGIRIMFGVDVVLGPLLTFIVFNASKPRREIVTDLSLIALVQVAALTWGIHTVHGQRPVAIVEFDGTLQSVIAESYQSQKIDLATLKQFDSREPAIIFQRVPTTSEELVKSFRLANGGWQRSAQDFLYERFMDQLPQVFIHAAKFEEKIAAKTPALKSEFQRMRAKHGETVGFLPFKGRYGDAIVVIARNGEIVDAIKQ